MKPLRWIGLPALLALLTLGTPTPARALMIAPAPLPLRVAAADAVVSGKVTALAAATVPAEMFAGDQRTLQIATVRVGEAVLGSPGMTVQVGFFPPAAPMVGGAGGPRLIISSSRRGGPTLSLGQEALLFLTKHPTKKGVFVVQMPFDVINKTGTADFAAQLAEAKKAARRLREPLTALGAADAAERYETAAMLLTRYRTARGDGKTEPLGAEESKRLLTALAEADWNTRRPGAFQMNPQGLFANLGLTAKDGWTPPTDFRQFPQAAKKWLADHAGTYRIQRYTWSKAGDLSPEPSPE